MLIKIKVIKKKKNNTKIQKLLFGPPSESWRLQKLTEYFHTNRRGGQEFTGRLNVA
jgi:hypothetical protein